MLKKIPLVIYRSCMKSNKSSKPQCETKEAQSSSKEMHKNCPSFSQAEQSLPRVRAAPGRCWILQPWINSALALERCWDWLGEAAGIQNKTSPDHRSFQPQFWMNIFPDIFSPPASKPFCISELSPLSHTSETQPCTTALSLTSSVCFHHSICTSLSFYYYYYCSRSCAARQCVSSGTPMEMAQK